MPPPGPGPRPAVDPQSCSRVHDAADTPAAGTAPPSRFFLALEQDGPWGRVAATQSRLDPALGRLLDERCAGAQGRLALVRRPGPHPDSPSASSRHVFLAYTGRRPWLLAGRVADPAALLQLDLAALGAGDRARALATLPGLREHPPVLLLCTNGRRDLCCATRGRPLALAAAAAFPDRVWESSHTGGHRFAPTGVLLPQGRYLGRLDLALAGAALRAADRGELPTALAGSGHDRGACRLTAPEQVAEATVRARIGEAVADALDASAWPGHPRPEGARHADDGPATRVTVRHTDGRSWQVTVRQGTGPDLPESCGKGAVPTRTWAVV